MLFLQYTHLWMFNIEYLLVHMSQRILHCQLVPETVVDTFIIFCSVREFVFGSVFVYNHPHISDGNAGDTSPK